MQHPFPVQCGRTVDRILQFPPGQLALSRLRRERKQRLFGTACCSDVEEASLRARKVSNNHLQSVVSINKTTTEVSGLRKPELLSFYFKCQGLTSEGMDPLKAPLRKAVTFPQVSIPGATHVSETSRTWLLDPPFY